MYLSRYPITLQFFELLSNPSNCDRFCWNYKLCSLLVTINGTMCSCLLCNLSPETQTCVNEMMPGRLVLWNVPTMSDIFSPSIESFPSLCVNIWTYNLDVIFHHICFKTSFVARGTKFVNFMVTAYRVLLKHGTEN